jgi:hypothetical protein
MTVLDRRNFLALGGAWWSMRPSAGETTSANLPRAWTGAESFAIWPAGAPGAAQFTPQAVPEDWRPDFLRNIAEPRLHVFRPARPNGKAFLVVRLAVRTSSSRCTTRDCRLPSA